MTPLKNEIDDTPGAKFGIQLVLKSAAILIDDDTAKHFHINPQC